MSHFLCHGEVVVVETDADRYLGTAEVDGEFLVVRSGLVGRPFRVPLAEVMSVNAVDTEPGADDGRG